MSSAQVLLAWFALGGVGFAWEVRIITSIAPDLDPANPARLGLEALRAQPLWFFMLSALGPFTLASAVPMQIAHWRYERAKAILMKESTKCTADRARHDDTLPPVR